MLSKLALKNIKKSVRDYSVYFFTLVVAVCIFYIFNSIDSQTTMLQLSESKENIIKALIMMLGYVSVFVSIILGFLIIYSNNFLIKRRKKEFGLYLTLGMSKRNVSTILVIETLLVGLLSLAVGLLVGVFLSQFLSVVTAKMFEVNMSSYKFVFSLQAVIKTITYFGIIYVLVMIFNIFTVSKYKIIDLLSASRKNEKVHFRNKYVIFISFILAIVLLVYAYKLLFGGVLFTLDKKMIYMIVSGALGTLFLFFSVSGFFLKVSQLFKNFYYKNLNMFVIKQINSKVNTTVISTTIICLMLLLTIGILSGSMSLASVYNSDVNVSNKTDFTIKHNASTYYTVNSDGSYSADDTEYVKGFDSVTNNSSFTSVVNKYAELTYYTDDVNYNSLIDDETKDQITQKYGDSVNFNAVPIEIISLSDYNKAMSLFGKSELTLAENQYALTCDIEEVQKWYSKLYKNNNQITVNGQALYPKGGDIISVSFENGVGFSNEGIIIVNDDIASKLNIESQSLIGNYNKKLSEDEENSFVSTIKNTNKQFSVNTKTEMENSTLGVKTIVIYISLYLGIIFAISSATILAIGQLSEASDNKERYRVLKLIGADDKMTKGALFTQIAVAFLLPLVVAIFHAFFGLRELNGLIKMVGNVDLSSNLLLTSLFILIVYGGYFLATYLFSKKIVKE